MDAILDALRADEPDLPDVDERTRRFVALAREVHRAAKVVALEGPASLTEATDRIARASAELSQVMRRMVGDAHAGDTARKDEDTALAAAREEALYRAVRDLRLAARGAIGGTD
ncbi:MULTISPECIES: hypothetical protein [unclassified Streptomyces]|uniref:hypothetical protein n=1 Tax=unclassified Streptomyces TaxID=2593676 RepID=UPI00371F314D